MQRSLPMSAVLDLSLYVITEPLPDRSPLEIAAAAYAGGAGVVQYRHKGATTRELFLWAQQLAALARDRGKLLIINDRVDLAQAARAAGVHLGPDDLPVSAARRVLGPTAVIGASVSTVEEAIEAEAEGASYLGVGCIYGTRSKDDAGEAVGPARVAEIRAAVGLPLVAIGGITAAQIPELAAAGADGIAVITAVTRARHMKLAARELARAMTAAKAGR
ncbi:MAG TPA: thiamine phosphate synthase [Armatimonadota bacterium]|nr:thiamine phosphate synthase [Armatimonadota bacterium]